MTRIALPQLVERLRVHYGQPKPPKLAGPWEMILWENVAYLADDERRRRAFQTLKKRIGTDPARILSASEEALLEVTRHGILADRFAEKLRECAKIALEEFDGNLHGVLKLPMAKAKKALQRFPGIGEPGAEKILLFTRSHLIPALESNGLRVLLRLGFGKEMESYVKTYRLVRGTIEEGIDNEYSLLIELHLLLRRHGQQLCKSSEPECANCPLAPDCEFRLGGGA